MLMMLDLRTAVVAVFYFICFVGLPATVKCVTTRSYYIGAVEVEWDFAPSGMDLVHGNRGLCAVSTNSFTDTEFRPLASNTLYSEIVGRYTKKAAVFIERTSSTIGRVYKKTVFRRFKDDTFTQRTDHPDWMGILGPVIIGEVGDTLTVTFKNFASLPFTMHPHGALYDKRSEGALYKDLTSGADKADDAVKPGSTHVYTWNITSRFGPSNDDPDCIAWLYHSHRNAVKDTNTGLIGPLVTCKKGIIDKSGTRLDGSLDRFLLFKIFEERLSWYMADNMRKCLNPALCSHLHTSGDADFKESNLMHSINGYVYGNMPHVRLCSGQRVNWHLMGLGAHVDMHTVVFNGHTMNFHTHRVQTVSLFPAEVKTASMRVTNKPGLWMISCKVNDHYSAGMQAFMEVKLCNTPPPAQGSRATRSYFIAVEEVLWNYAPSGYNQHTGTSLNDPGSASFKFFGPSNTRIGGTYKKARYIAFTDDTFTHRVNVSAQYEHFGIIGPLIRAEVGDRIRIVFKNMATHNFSIVTSFLPVVSPDYGSLHLDNTTDHGVAPGKVETFIWSVPEKVRPTDRDYNCVASFYYSTVDIVRDTNSGLVGPMLVCKPGTIDGLRKKRIREFFLIASITDENLSAYIDENIARLVKKGSGLAKDKDFIASNKMTNINGFSYGNLPGLSMCLEERVVWHLIGLGTETGVHSLHFYGNTFVRSRNRGQTANLFPGIIRTVTMKTDNPGRWAIVCYTNDHLTNGLSAAYTVKRCGINPGKHKTKGPLRRFYIAAVEVDWDYAPNKDGLGMMPATNPKSMRYAFVRNDTGYIGSVYRKAVYKQYTDDTYTHEIRGDGDVHLGLVGPTLHVEVGDRVEIIFKNMASIPFSLHSQGLSYNSTNAGSSFATSHSGVQPGNVFVYNWYVPERSGPASDDTNCIPWPYISAVNPVRDTSSGLFGAIIVCRKGILAGKNKQRTDDIDREFVLYFHVIDENLSWYIQQNIAKYAPKRVEDEKFRESNLYYSINGGLFGNTRGLTMYKGEKVAWYIIGLGNEIDIHSVHFHGQTALLRKSGLHSVDVISVFPGTTQTVVMVAENPGRWLLHCHLNHHIMHGMDTVFDIKQRETKPTSVTTVTTGRHS